MQQQAAVPAQKSLVTPLKGCWKSTRSVVQSCRSATTDGTTQRQQQPHMPTSPQTNGQGMCRQPGSAPHRGCIRLKRTTTALRASNTHTARKHRHASADLWQASEEQYCRIRTRCGAQSCCRRLLAQRAKPRECMAATVPITAKHTTIDGKRGRNRPQYHRLPCRTSKAHWLCFGLLCADAAGQHMHAAQHAHR